MTLRVELSIEPSTASAAETFTAVCAVVNAGDTAEEINLAALSSPSLVLELRTGDGQPVFMPPPPVPSGEPAVRLLAPWERHVASFEGFLPGWMEAGRYEARGRYRSGSVVAHSGWVPFSLESGPANASGQGSG